MKTRAVMIVCVALVLVLASSYLLGPLHRSDEHIQSWVLHKAPPGSSVGDVRALIQRQRWKLDFEWKGTNSPATPREYPYVRGSRIIGACLGGYEGIPWHADVDAFWGFDDGGRLIDFRVRKDYDSL